MSSTRSELIDAAIARFHGVAASSRANLNVYLSNPAGIGEHRDIVSEVVQLTKEIAEAEECLVILEEMKLQ